MTDMHTCPLVTGVVPHVGGPILPPCCPTVLIGMLPAARMTDMATCVGPPDAIAKGSPTVLIGALMAARLGDLTLHGGVIVAPCCPTVIIGDAPGGSIILRGTPAEQAQLRALIESSRTAGPLGQAFIQSLETAATPTEIFIGTSATRADGTVISLATTGGGVTLRPTESASGNNEVHIDPTNLINYTA